jgi:hypothetical protein
LARIPCVFLPDFTHAISEVQLGANQTNSDSREAGLIMRATNLPPWSEALTCDAKWISIRTAGERDIDQLAEYFARLSRVSRHNRFMGEIDNCSKAATSLLVDDRNWMASPSSRSCGPITLTPSSQRRAMGVAANQKPASSPSR